MRRPGPALPWLAIPAAALALSTSGARAQTTVNLWPGVAPGSGSWSWKERVFRDVVEHGRNMGTIVQDVTVPTLTVYLPSRDSATGTGIIIAPGGACIALAMKPAEETARWLQARGVAAFVLKYRLKKRGKERGIPPGLDEDEACRWGIADAIRALQVVRGRAAEWGVSPDRVGMVGFSAGGMLASEALVQEDSTRRPSFAGLIYGAPFASMPVVPAGLPPVFMAWARDDPLATHAMLRFYAALLAAGDRAEAHVFTTGGHGFAGAEQGTTSDHWREEFFWWLQDEGLLGAGPPG